MNRLTEIRDELSLSRARLSKLSGVPSEALERYEKGQGILLRVERPALVKALFEARLERLQEEAEDRRMRKACRQLRQLRQR